MSQPDSPRRGLKLLCLVCLAGLPPVLAAFAVNIELGLRVFFPGAVWLEHTLPAAWFARLAFFSVDLSTVSTLVPVLLLLYPLVQGLRVLRRPAHDHAFLRNLASDPYPPHFAFFLVMLGLVGTLHGMWIGLRNSGVSGLGEGKATAETIQSTLDLLIGGTATAVLSSLVGIIAAFFAAKPIPWLFRRLIGLQEEEQRHTLSETMAHLTRDLQGLSTASRDFAALLGPAGAQELARRAASIEEAVRACGARQDAAQSALMSLLQVQTDAAAQLRRLESVEAALREQGARSAAAHELLQRLVDAQARGAAALESFVAAMDARQKAQEAHLAELVALARGGAEESRAERGALRRALAEFAK